MSRAERVASVERALAHHSGTGMIYGYAPPEPPHHDPNRRSKWRIDLDRNTSLLVDLTGAHNLCLALRRAEMAYGNVTPPKGDQVRIAMPASEVADVLRILQWRADGGVLGSDAGGKQRARDLRDSMIAGISIEQREMVRP